MTISSRRKGRLRGRSRGRGFGPFFSRTWGISGLSVVRLDVAVSNRRHPDARSLELHRTGEGRTGDGIRSKEAHHERDRIQATH